MSDWQDSIEHVKATFTELNTLKKRLLEWASEVKEQARVAMAEGCTLKTRMILEDLAKEMREAGK